MRFPGPIAVVLWCALAPLVAGCGGGGSAPPGEGLRVVATTTPVADLAAGVAGEQAEVHVLLPAGADPHDHEIRAEDVTALADADVVVRSGGDLDAWLDEALESAGGDAEVVDLMAEVEPPERDPHWWLDPVSARAATPVLAESFAAARPALRASFERAGRRQSKRLKALEADIRGCLRVIPDDDRELVTTHDAFGAYARRFDLEVVGALVPALSDHGQASAGETAELIAAIRHRDVRAVFPESGGSLRLAEAVAREAGARVGPPLWVDSLGPAGSGPDTYVTALAANTRSLVTGITGRQAACDFGD